MRAKLLFLGTPAARGEDGGHLKQHDVCCLLFLSHFSLIPAQEIYGSISARDFSKGDNLSTPHRRRLPVRLLLSASPGSSRLYVLF